VSRATRPQSRSYFAATAAFRDGEGSPRAFLEHCIETIDALDPQIGAFVATNYAGARAAADAASERWRSGKILSLIDGMPVGIKDIMETADMVTEQGSPLFVGWRGRRDAAAVAALREAGAVIVGKTVTTEFASTHPAGTRNPWDLERTPGGSSSGSAAAVAAGMLPAALGTQVVGSIVRPASFCGCFGYKPSVGGINRGGSFDEFSQSCSGVLAATLGEAWTVAREITARIGGDPGSPGILGPLELPPARQPRRVALLETAGWARASDEAKQALQGARERLAAAGIAVADRGTDPTVAAVEAAIAEVHQLSLDINAWEGRWPLNTYARDIDRAGLSKSAQERLAQAETMTQEEYQRLLAERDRIRAVYATLQEQYDACIGLPATGAAPRGLETTGNPVFAAVASLLGTPSLSLPLLEAEGLPLGLHVIGFRNEDAAMFAAAAGILPLFGS
jgi:Asp-tRNA(Asn)/Glu-tRNA(Gln) amidotransferase A subunit family amidase